MEIGKWFEKQTQDALDLVARRHPVKYVRLYDTTSARGAFLPSQPGDYIVAHQGTATLLECKASEVHTSLTQCFSNAIKTDQAAHHRLWNRTGNPSLFLFYSEPTREVEVWVGGPVADLRAVKGKLGESYRLHVAPVSQSHAVAHLERLLTALFT